jgi:hypothetical protein
MGGILRQVMAWGSSEEKCEERGLPGNCTQAVQVSTDVLEGALKG